MSHLLKDSPPLLTREQAATEIRKPQNQSPMTDANGAAEYLDVETGTLATWRCTGRYNLPFVKIGRSVKYLFADLDALIARNTVSGGTI